MSSDTLWLIVTLLLLGVITMLTRSFFFISQRELNLPGWVQRGLRYAPLAALAAVVAPEVILTQGLVPNTWWEPRWWAALSAGLWFVWRGGVLGTIVVGMTVLSLLKFGLGW